MHRAALALTIAVSGTGCSERSVAPAQAPSVPLADVLSAIKQEVAEYNHQATAAPIRLNCNGHQAISMRLIGVKVEVQSSLVSRMGRDAAPEVFWTQYRSSSIQARQQALLSRTGKPPL